ncbi:MAG TPA: ABC transporter permease [Vicinamibacterales bacterium]
MLARFRSLARHLRRRSAFEDAMDAEMRFHLESRTADLVGRGLPPAEAARQARLEFGSIEKQKDEARAGAGLRRLDELGGDLRYACRGFRRDKTFAATAIVTLALGIGANAAIFTLIDALVLRALPVSRPGELDQLALGSKIDQRGDPSFSYPMVLALDREREVFTSVAGFSGFSFSEGSGASPQRVSSAVVTGQFYETLGLQPAAGRLLEAADDQPGAPLVAVASFAYWQRERAGNPAAVGQRLLLNGVPVELVGVSPRGFTGANVGAMADITVPVAAIARLTPAMSTLLGTGNTWLRVLARRRGGVTQEQAAARLAAAWPRIAEAAINPAWSGARKRSVSEAIVRFGPGATGWTYLRELYVTPLRVLMAAASLVLLIACANVASLLLARASSRRRETAVRMALGASRARVIRQLLVESLILALVGAAAGVVLAWDASRLLVGLISSGGSPLVFDLTPNWRLLGYTTAVASGTALLFGIAPAFHATAWGAHAALRDDARTGSARQRLLPWLVAAQIAVSLVLLVGAALFIRTLRNLQTLDPGFKAEGVLFVEFERGPARVPSTALDAVRAIPGVVSASVATHTPLSGASWGDPLVPAGQPIPERDTALLIGVAPGFFRTLDMTLTAGRDFTDRDQRESPGVAIVNQRYADAYFPHENPIGHHLAGTVNGAARDLEIVGVARNTNTGSLRSTPPRTVYLPYAQVIGATSTNVVVRATGSLIDVAAALRRTLQPLAPVTPLEARPLSDQVRDAIGREHLMAVLAGAFGALALTLAAVGIYGLLAFAVARRTREIGIRVALGARRGSVIALMLRAAQLPLVAGVAIGAVAAWIAARAVESMLFGLTPHDSLALGGAIAVLLVVAHVAAYLPARRAARVDPLVALKSE